MLTVGGAPFTVKTGFGVGRGVGVGGTGVGDGVGVGGDTSAEICAPAGVNARTDIKIPKIMASASIPVATLRRFMLHNLLSTIFVRKH